MIRKLDTSRLGPIRIDMAGRSIARDMYADAVAARGPAWRNAADSVRSGQYANAWIEAAIAAIDKALRDGPNDAE